MRRSSALVAVDPQWRVLLQHRTEDAPSWPGYWGLFGGGEEEGETPERALLRELDEELGLDVSGAVQSGRLVLEGFQEGNIVITAFYMVMEAVQAKPWRLIGGMTEGQGLGFFHLRQMESMLVVPHDMAVVELVLRNRRLRSPSP